ncbi:jg3567 [Pararge aegeria aegeria]|uniref:Jg3567 protein n=1 Tax=Pararge aegeria aegeria TaxID=348720 RepID=A0A8S4QU34_9NEOP|nr:jg3567 [Pararge aegeria aegeria]
MLSQGAVRARGGADLVAPAALPATAAAPGARSQHGGSYAGARAFLQRVLGRHRAREYLVPLPALACSCSALGVL